MSVSYNHYIMKSLFKLLCLYLNYHTSYNKLPYTTLLRLLMSFTKLSLSPSRSICGKIGVLFSLLSHNERYGITDDQ
jgi:hypothetical protein